MRKPGAGSCTVICMQHRVRHLSQLTPTPTQTPKPHRMQIMWKFLEQQSFHLSREEYDEQMAAVADIVSEWGAADM